MRMHTMVASACTFVSLVLTIVSVSYVIPFRNSVVRMTVARTVGSIVDVNNVLSAYASYSVAANSMNLSGAVFAGAANVQNGSVLQSLMDASGCSLLPARPWATPVNRSDRCRCIAGVYLAYLNETSSVANSLFLNNMSANASLNASVNAFFNAVFNLANYTGSNASIYRSVPLAMRGAYKDRLMGCLSSRPVWQVTWCGSQWCERSPLELAYLMNCVLFLCTTGYLLIVAVPDSMFPSGYGGPAVWRKVILFVIVSAQIGGMWAFSVDRVHLESIGLVVVFLNLAVNLHPGALTDARGGKEAGVGHHGSVPHPLVLCLYSNLKVLLPLYSLQVAILGYARDWVAFLGFGINGFIIAVSIQSLMCEIWYSPLEIRSMQCMVCFLVLGSSMAHSVLLTASYTYTDSPYISYYGTPIVVSLCTAFLALFGTWEYTREGRIVLEKKAGKDLVFTVGDAALFAAVQFVNILLTAFAVFNAGLGQIVGA